MSRRLALPTIAALLPVGIVLLAGWRYLASDRWLKRRIHEAITIQAAQTLGAEVRTGGIEGSLFHGLRIKDVAIAEDGGFAAGTLASADEVRLRHDLWAVLRGRKAALESVTEVRVTGARLRLSRGPDGRLNAARYLRMLRGPKPGLGRFRGRIIVTDSDISYSDAAPRPRWLSGADLRFVRLDGEADFADADALRWQAQADGVAGPIGRLQVSGAYRPATGAVYAEGALSGLALPELYGRFARRPEVQVEAGVADLRGSFCAVPRDFLDYSVVGHAGGVRARVAALGRSAIAGSVGFAATPAGLRLRGLHASVLGASVRAEGSLFGLSSRPALDLRGDADRLDPRRWTAVFPDLKHVLAVAPGVRSVRLVGRIAGPLSDPEVNLAAHLPGTVAVDYRLPPEPTKDGPPGEVAEPQPPQALSARVRGLVIQAALPDLRTRDAALRVAADEVALGDLASLVAEPDDLKHLQPEPATQASADLFYSGKSLAAAGRLSVARVATDHGEVAGLRVRYAAAEKTIRAQVTADNALGAEVTADGIVDLADSRPSVYAEFSARAVDLATAASVARREVNDLGGTVAASGFLTAKEGEVEGAARIAGNALRVGPLEFDRAVADVAFGPPGLDLRYAAATGPLGAWSLRGRMPEGGPAELEVSAANVPLRAARSVLASYAKPDGTPAPPPAAPGPPDQEPKPENELKGVAFVHGSVRGSNEDDITVEAHAAAFDVGLGERTAKVVTGAIAASPRSVELNELVARRGAAVLSGRVALSDLLWPPDSPFALADDENLPPAPAPEALDGSLTGSLALTGFDLSQLGDFASLPEGCQLAGLASSDRLTLSGTLRAPRAQANIAVTNGRLRCREPEFAVGPVALRAEAQASLDEATIRADAETADSGRANLEATLTGWDTEEGARIDGTFAAHGLPVTGFFTPRGALRPVDGRLDLDDGRVAGPLKGPGPDFSAQASSPLLRFGRREVRDLSVRLGHEDGMWKLTKGAFTTAGGQVRLPAAGYRPENRWLEAGLQADAIQAKELLLWAGDVARQSGDPGSAAETRDRFYGLAHRTRGRLALGDLTIRGPLGDLSGEVAGLAVGQATLDRRPLPSLSLAGRFSGLDLGGREPPGEGEHAKQGDGMLTHLHLDDLALDGRVGRGSVTAGGSIHWDGDVKVTAQADLVPLDELEPWLPVKMDLGGQAAVTVQAIGPARDPEIRGSIEVFRPTIAGVGFDLLQLTRIDVRKDEIVLVEGILKHRQHEVQAAGRLPFDRDAGRLDPEGPVAFDAKAADLPLPVLFELADEFVRRRGRGAAPDSFWKHCRGEGLVTASLNVAGKLKDPQVGGGLFVGPGATFRLDSWPEATLVRDIVVDTVLRPSPGGVGAVVDILNVAGKVDNTDLALYGRAEVSHLAPGRLLDNRVDGVTFAAKAVRQRLPGNTVAKDLNVEAEIHTDPSRWLVVTINQGTAKLGRGQARLSGRMLIDSPSLANLGRAPANLRLDLDRAQVAWGDWVKSAEVDGSIAATKFASQTGRRLPPGLLGEPFASGPTAPGAPIRLASVSRGSPGDRGSLIVSRARLDVPPTPPTARSAPLLGLPLSWPAPDLDIVAALGRQVRVDNAVLQARLALDPQALVITGSPQAPRIALGLRVQEGALELLRGQLGIEEGDLTVSIEPTSADQDQPARRLPLTMTTRLFGRAAGTVRAATPEGQDIGPVRVALTLSGGLPPNQKLTTTSSPALSEDEIKRLLAFSPVQPGQLAPRQGGAAGDVLASVVGQRIFASLLRPLERELTSALGLSELSLNVGTGEPVQLRVGKYLVDDLLFSYQRAATGPRGAFDLRLSYQVKPQYQITFHTDERARQDLTVEYRWTF